jgi:hypothetical protein
LDGVIARYLQLGFSVIVRDDDYKNIYGAEPHPRRPVKDFPRMVGLRALVHRLGTQAGGAGRARRTDKDRFRARRRGLSEIDKSLLSSATVGCSSFTPATTSCASLAQPWHSIAGLDHFHMMQLAVP